MRTKSLLSTLATHSGLAVEVGLERVHKVLDVERGDALLERNNVHVLALVCHSYSWEISLGQTEELEHTAQRPM